MKFKMLLLMVIVFMTTNFAFANNSNQSGFLSADSIKSGLNGGNNGSGGTAGGGTTGGGTTGGGTTGGGTTGGGTTGGGTTGGGTTGGGNVGCTRTQGYWGSSPAGQAQLIVLVGAGGMNLGSVNYSAAQLDSILDAATGGNALIILAQQLIAAKLNVLNGADASQIADDTASADSLIGSLVVPPVGSGSVAPGSALGIQMIDVKDVLDDYNNGLLNVPHCD